MSTVFVPFQKLEVRRSSGWRPWAQLAGTFVMALAVAPAMAQISATPVSPASAITVELTQSKVVKGVDGKEQFLDATSVKPGDVLEYRATYSNRSAASVKSVVAALPIPEGLQYQPKSAKPFVAALQAATNDGKFGAEPLVRTVTGKTVPVPYADYRTLRWNLNELAAGAKTTVSARVVVQVFVPVVVPVAAATQAILPKL